MIKLYFDRTIFHSNVIFERFLIISVYLYADDMMWMDDGSQNTTHEFCNRIILRVILF